MRTVTLVEMKTPNGTIIKTDGKSVFTPDGKTFVLVSLNSDTKMVRFGERAAAIIEVNFELARALFNCCKKEGRELVVSEFYDERMHAKGFGEIFELEDSLTAAYRYLNS